MEPVGQTRNPHLACRIEQVYWQENEEAYHRLVLQYHGASRGACDAASPALSGAVPPSVFSTALAPPAAFGALSPRRAAQKVGRQVLGKRGAAHAEMSAHCGGGGGICSVTKLARMSSPTLTMSAFQHHAHRMC